MHRVPRNCFYYNLLFYKYGCWNRWCLPLCPLFLLVRGPALGQKSCVENDAQGHIHFVAEFWGALGRSATKIVVGSIVRSKSSHWVSSLSESCRWAGRRRREQTHMKNKWKMKKKLLIRVCLVVVFPSVFITHTTPLGQAWIARRARINNSGHCMPHGGWNIKCPIVYISRHMGSRV